MSLGLTLSIHDLLPESPPEVPPLRCCPLAWPWLRRPNPGLLQQASAFPVAREKSPADSIRGTKNVCFYGIRDLGAQPRLWHLFELQGREGVLPRSERRWELTDAIQWKALLINANFIPIHPCQNRSLRWPQLSFEGSGCGPYHCFRAWC